MFTLFLGRLSCVNYIEIAIEEFFTLREIRMVLLQETDYKNKLSAYLPVLDTFRC